MKQENIKKNVAFIKKNFTDALRHVPCTSGYDKNAIQRLLIWSTADGQIKHLGPSSEDLEKLIYSIGFVYHSDDGFPSRVEYRRLQSSPDMDELELSKEGEETIKESLKAYTLYLKDPKNLRHEKAK